MANDFSALKAMSADLKAKAREREAQREKEESVRNHIARETRTFLDAMQKSGVRASGAMKLPPKVQSDDIDFAAAMKKAGVAPLTAQKRVQHRTKPVSTVPRQTLADQKAVLAESMMSDDNDSIEFLESEDGLSFRRPGIGPDVPRDLRRGRWAVVGQIDLHGMFVEEAREAVAHFLHICQMQERLCVRIIHGKGHGSPQGQSILREKVRRWLKQRDEVIAFAQPHEHDGGAGATIVRLRPFKKPQPGQPAN